MDLDDEELEATRRMKGLNKSKADEMFKKLGYDIEVWTKTVEYKKNRYAIIFNLTKKDIKIENYFSRSTKTHLTMQELQAIYTKCEELRMDSIDILIQLAFELGQSYQTIYLKLGLDNVIDFNDIKLANNRGAQWKFKGDMSDIPKLFEVHKLKQEGIDELNKIADNLQQVKDMAKCKELRWIE